MLNGTYICTHAISNNTMVLDKQYTFTDGKFIREDGDICHGTYESIEHFNLQNYSKIKEVK